MMRYLMLLTLTAGLTGGLMAPPPAFAAKVPQAGQLTVDDEAKAFTPEGVKKAEDAFHAKTFKSATHFHVHTVTVVPEGKKKDFDAAKADKKRAPAFFLDWARETAKADHDRGVFTFVYMSEDGQSFYILTIADSQTDRARGFTDEDGRKTSDKLIAAFREAKTKTGVDAQKARDAGLLDATNFVIEQLKNTSANDTATGTGKTLSTEEKSGSSSIMSYVCIGIVALLGIWLVIGLIRAFTGGGGGGGGGGYGGGGYGGGGGGGGFMTSMLGGMFGAAAGMYLYDQFAGHHGSDLSAGQSNDYGSTSADDGAGDFDGGSAGGGGDFGDSGGGDYGGGDFGGDSGGGDFGGGDF